jgi:hypothetical protein
MESSTGTRIAHISDELYTHSHAADRVESPRERQDHGHAVWSVSSGELCQPRAETASKPVTESNPSLCVPAQVPADMSGHRVAEPTA